MNRNKHPNVLQMFSRTITAQEFLGEMVLVDVGLNLLFVKRKASELTLDRRDAGGGLTEFGGIVEAECVTELSNRECSS